MWRRGEGLSVAVNASSWTYTVAVHGRVWLADGTIGLTCGGRRYALDDASLLALGDSSEYSAASPAGRFDAIERVWRAGSCARFISTVRFYRRSGVVEFVSTLPDGAEATATSPPSLRREYRGAALRVNVSTEFPSFALPSPNACAALRWQTWDGRLLFAPFKQGSAAQLAEWSGGLTAGPLVLWNGTSGLHPPSVVVGASGAFKSAVLAAGGGRLVGGAQGMLASMPRGYSLGFAVQSGAGVPAAMLAWGAHLQAAHRAAARLTLADDVLSRSLHYLTDGGSNANFCDYWPACAASAEGCTPMHATLRRLAAYHASLALNVSLYHLDPSWYSHQPDGGCANIDSARNLTASPFHFPQGLAAVGLPLQLLFKFLAPDNVYTDEFPLDGLGVRAADARAFWDARFSRLPPSALRAVVWDGQADVWFSSDSRVNSTDEQQRSDGGFADAAYALRLPMRVDGALPSDLLASVGYPAFTAARVTGDAVPHDWFEAHNWVELAESSLLAAAVGVRPMADVLWTTASQPGDPRWAGCRRPNVRHDVAAAVLSTGPVGFGDREGGTDAAVLRRAARADGVLLKPCFAALRVGGDAAVVAAAAGPAGAAGARADARANSMARLEAAAGEAEAAWWWVVLATDAGARRLAVEELWPAAYGAMLAVPLDRFAAGDGDGAGAPRVGRRVCAHGGAAARCAVLWAEGVPLDVSTAAARGVQRSFSLLAAAPLLPSGWALLGELDKIVPVSPQRFVVPGGGEAPHARDFNASAELSFFVLGAIAERVSITLVALTSAKPTPQLEGTVVVVEVVVGETGCEQVLCARTGAPPLGECRVASRSPRAEDPCAKSN
ncbi:hypothetical protein AB1Y20_009729 [Prymnesium parvum]|uniref:Uncharacterized protein n=1 Tax=Prymnesium parvum TaxID=97485 RepID=A0AB34K1P4_PRYPA